VFGSVNTALDAVFAAFDLHVADPVEAELESILTFEIRSQYPCAGTLPSVTVKIEHVDNSEEIKPALECVDLSYYKSILGID